MATDLERFKQQLIPIFEERPEILFAYFFGSHTQERANPLSDVDIAVAIDKEKIRETDHPYGYRSHLTSFLMSALHTDRVDLVIFHEATPFLRYYILSQGVRIYSRDPNFDKRMFLEAFHHYQNTAPLRQIQEFYMKRYLRELGEPSAHGSN